MAERFARNIKYCFSQKCLQINIFSRYETESLYLFFSIWYIATKISLSLIERRVSSNINVFMIKNIFLRDCSSLWIINKNRIEESCLEAFLRGSPRLYLNGIPDRTYFCRKVESCPFRNDRFVYVSMQRARLYCDCIIHQSQSSRVTERCRDTFEIAIIRSAARPLKKMRLISGLPLAQSRLPRAAGYRVRQRKKKKRTVTSFLAATILQHFAIDLGRQL